MTGPYLSGVNPWVTAVGGTSLAIDSSGSMEFQTGWSTSAAVLLCTASEAQGGSCSVADEGTYVPLRPANTATAAVVALATSTLSPLTRCPSCRRRWLMPIWESQAKPTRRPDISMDADPYTGMLIGLTETFPSGVHYGQPTYGGYEPCKSAARRDHRPGRSGRRRDIPRVSHPVLYNADASGSAAGFYDVVPQGDLAVFFFNYANDLNTADGYVKSAVSLGYEGPETNCASPGNCQTQKLTIYTAPGYDNMTGLGTPAVASST